MKKLQKWREYETQISAKCKAYFPTSEITQNVKVKGQYSEVPREIDISIRITIDESPILGVIECKCFSKKINVKTVDSFIGFLEDVNADFGYLITTKGFSPGAENRAKSKGVSLRVIHYADIDSIGLDMDQLINQKISLLASIPSPKWR